MTGASLTIEAQGMEALLRSVAGLFHALVDKTPLMRNLASLLEMQTVERFATTTDPEGRPWKPSLRAQLTGGLTLTEYGVFRDRIVSDHGSDWFAAGTNDIRAKIFQFGGTILPKTGKFLRFRLASGAIVFARKVVMPARAYLGLSSGNRDEVYDMIAEYVAEAGQA